MTTFKGTAVVPVLASAPSSPTGGQLYYNSGDGNLYVYDAVAVGWVDCTAAAGGGASLSAANTWTAVQTFQKTDGTAAVVVDSNTTSTQAKLTLTGRDGSNAAKSASISQTSAGVFALTNAVDNDVEISTGGTVGKIYHIIGGSSRLIITNAQVGTNNSVPFVTNTTAGAPSGTTSDGSLTVDSTNHVLYFRSGSTWRAITAGASLSVANTWTAAQTIQVAAAALGLDLKTTASSTSPFLQFTHTGGNAQMWLSGGLEVTANRNIRIDNVVNGTDAQLSLLGHDSGVVARGSLIYHLMSGNRLVLDGVNVGTYTAGNLAIDLQVNGTRRLGISSAEVATNGVPIVTNTTAGAPSGTTSDGSVTVDTTNHALYFRSGSTWRNASITTFRTVHTFAIKGTLTAADSTPSFFFSKTAGQTTNIVKARYKVASGTNVTFKIQKNGSDWTGYGTTASPLTATTTAATTSQTNSLADDDEIDLVLVAVSGSPTDVTVTIVLEHTI